MGVYLNFAVPAKDAISLNGVLPVPAGVKYENQRVVADIGGVVKLFTLDAYGKSIPDKKGFVLQAKPRNGAAKYALRLYNGKFMQSLADELLLNQSVSNKPVTVVVKILFNGALHQQTKSLRYSATQNRAGKAK